MYFILMIQYVFDKMLDFLKYIKNSLAGLLGKSFGLNLKQIVKQ